MSSAICCVWLVIQVGSTCLGKLGGVIWLWRGMMGGHGSAGCAAVMLGVSCVLMSVRANVCLSPPCWEQAVYPNRL